MPSPQERSASEGEDEEQSGDGGDEMGWGCVSTSIVDDTFAFVAEQQWSHGVGGGWSSEGYAEDEE